MTLDSRSLSRLLAAAGLILAPILFGISDLVEPAWADDSADYLAEVAGGTNRHLAWAGLFAVGALLMLAGMIGTARLLRGGRGGAVGIAGAWMLGVSVTMAAGLVLAQAVLEVEMVSAAADRAEMVALNERTMDSTFGMVAFGLLFFGGFGLGSLLVAVGLLRRRAVPVWSPALILTWLVVLFASSSQVVNGLSFVLLVAAFAPIAARIASMPDEQWERWAPLPDREPRAARAGGLQPSRS
jgi:hypothetical protein